MNILIIKDDKPGHYNQTEGILLALEDIYPNIVAEYVDIEIKSKISRKLLRTLLNRFPSFFKNKNSLKYIKYFYKNCNLPKNNPDIIISTGGNTANLNAWFAKVYNAKNILNGKLRGLKEELFTNITTVIDLGYKNQIIIDVAPNIITTAKLKIESEKFSQKNNLKENYYTLLIGGDGAGYQYDDNFYEELINFLTKTSNTNKIKWLITTSRRTPLKTEEKLRERLKKHSAYFVAYNNKAEKVLLPFLGLSKVVFVTEESSSMISEGISAKKPIYTISPKYAYPDNNYKKILHKFLVEKKIKRINFVQLENFKIDLNDFEIMKNDTYEDIAKKMKEYI